MKFIYRGRENKKELKRDTQKGWDCKDDPKLKNMTLSTLIFSFCIQLSFLIIFKHRNKPVLAYSEPWMKENGLNKICTILC